MCYHLNSYSHCRSFVITGPDSRRHYPAALGNGVVHLFASGVKGCFRVRSGFGVGHILSFQSVVHSIDGICEGDKGVSATLPSESFSGVDAVLIASSRVFSASANDFTLRFTDAVILADAYR
jgi:hypothetical protein